MKHYDVDIALAEYQRIGIGFPRMIKSENFPALFVNKRIGRVYVFRLILFVQTSARKCDNVASDVDNWKHKAVYKPIIVCTFLAFSEQIGLVKLLIGKAHLIKMLTQGTPTVRCVAYAELFNRFLCKLSVIAILSCNLALI